MGTTSIKEIKKNYSGADRDMLIPMLQDIQEIEGYLSKEALQEVGDMLNLPLSKIYGVASFYNQFRFTPIGTYYIQICRGTACHVKGSLKVLDAFKQELGISEGETTKDGLFTLEIVACIGACGLAPVITVNGEFYAKMTPEKASDLINDLRSKNDAKK